MRINVEKFYKRFGESEKEHEEIAIEIESVLRKRIPKDVVENIDVYNMTGEVHGHKDIGRIGKRLIIFNNGKERGADSTKTLDDGLVINGKTYPELNTVFRNPLTAGYMHIVDDNGVVLAAFSKEYWHLDIYFDLFSKNSNEMIEVFDFIIESLESYFLRFANRFSWLEKENRDKLIKEIERSNEGEIRQRVNSLERNIESLKRDSKRAIEEVMRNSNQEVVYMKQVKALKDGSGLSSKIEKDLNLLADNELIKNIKVKESKLIFSTEPLIITTEKGVKHRGGGYDIEFDMINGGIVFSSDLNKQGFWTQNDPHPHVNGNSGDACFGNVGSTIMELSSQKEIYALVLFILDFLQSANTDDPAGENVRYWDIIDESGNVIKSTASMNESQCEQCGGVESNDDLIIAYRTYNEGDDVLDGEISVCEHCVGDTVFWNDLVEEYVVETYNEVSKSQCDYCGEIAATDDMEKAFDTYDENTMELKDEMLVCEFCFENNFQWVVEVNEYVDSIIPKEGE